MRLLLDECVPRRLTRELTGHQARLRDRLAGMRVAGLLAGFGGVLVLAWPNLTASGDRLAALAALGATVLYALSAHFTRRRFSGTPPLVVASGSQVAPAVTYLIPMFGVTAAGKRLDPRRARTGRRRDDDECAVVSSRGRSAVIGQPRYASLR